MKLRRHLAPIAWKEFQRRLSSGWVIICFAVWLGAIGLTSFYGLVQVGRIGLQGYERTVVSLLNLTQYLVPLLALLVGHDLIVGEREDRTLALVVASGVSRSTLLFGKFVGGSLALIVPIALGFILAGTAIGLASHDRGLGAFILLAGSSLGLGVLFLAIGLAISSLSRTRVQSLVFALLAWGIAVFAFDLVALGIVISAKAPAVAQEIEVACDATHLNAAADLHSAYDAQSPTQRPSAPTPAQNTLSWLALDPVDAFRSVNLASQFGLPAPWLGTGLAAALWLFGSLGLSIARFRRIDL